MAFAFGASMSIASCSSQALYGAPVPPDAAQDVDDANGDVGVRYGAPPPPDGAADVEADAAVDATADVGVRYGAPPPPDGGP